MARVKLQLPAHEIFRTELSVRITDINYGNHLGNESLVGLLQEVRVRWLKHLGLSELDIGGVGLIMADLEVEYKSEGFCADILTLVLYAGEFSTHGFELFYSVTNQHEQLIAKAKTGMVCFSYDTKKVMAVPDGFKRQVLPG